MKEVPYTTFRQSMHALHTWAGVVLGSLIFVIFWMGTLSVFDREIDRWMMPATRLASPKKQPHVKLDGLITETATQLTKGVPQWSVRLPGERVPAIELRWRNEVTKTAELRLLHPQTGAVLSNAQTLAGTGFIFPFHDTLQIKWKDVGEWLVGLAGMAMLVMVVSGAVMHRRIFADFFTFRPKKAMQRASLDLHNLMGVLALPFHVLMPLTGVVLLFSLCWPSAHMGHTPWPRPSKIAKKPSRSRHMDSSNVPKQTSLQQKPYRWMPCWQRLKGNGPAARQTLCVCGCRGTPTAMLRCAAIT